MMIASPADSGETAVVKDVAVMVFIFLFSIMFALSSLSRLMLFCRSLSAYVYQSVF